MYRPAPRFMLRSAAPLTVAAALAFTLPAQAEPERIEVTCTQPPTSPTADGETCDNAWYLMLPLVDDYAAFEVVVTNPPEQCRSISLSILSSEGWGASTGILAPGQTERFPYSYLEPPMYLDPATWYHTQLYVTATSHGTGCGEAPFTGWIAEIDLVEAGG